MRKILLFLTPVLLAVVVFLIFMFFASKSTHGNGALQVTSLPASTVFLNDKRIGKTPVCRCEGQNMIPSGSYTVKLVPEDVSKEPYIEKIVINPSVLTVVDRTFGETGKSSGSVISLDPIQDNKKAQLFVSSFPYGADISIDSVSVGTTPLLQQITDSDHEVIVSKAGYKTKTIRIHGVLGYKLDSVVYLATEDITAAQPSPAVQPATQSAQQDTSPKVTILSTPTGFLRVRDSASLNGEEITQVHPGEVYPFVQDQDGWIQIKLTDGREGWVNAQYAKKQ